MISLEDKAHIIWKSLEIPSLSYVVNGDRQSVCFNGSNGNGKSRRICYKKEDIEEMFREFDSNSLDDLKSSYKIQNLKLMLNGLDAILD